jgi:alpha-L-fucosidase
LAAAAVVAFAVLIVRLVVPFSSSPVVAFRSTPGSELALTATSGKPLDIHAGRMPIGSRMTLGQGVVKLTFASGVDACVRGPARFQFTGKDQLRLEQGAGWFQVPAPARGFRVITGQLNVTDLGTEFGVIAGNRAVGDEVHVFRGKVQAAPKGGNEEQLVAGNARRIEENGLVKIAPDLSQFNTSLPQTLADRSEPIPSEQPSAAQKVQIARKYGMFCHFGMNTYTDVEWGNGKTPAGTFAPPPGFEEKIDGWVKTAHDAGMRYFICVAKHQDGFCLWDSKATDYCTSNPEIKNHVDVVKAVAAACRKYNVAFAVYYFLSDRHEPSYSDPKAYKEFMLKQLRELMSNYGPVCELVLNGSVERQAKDWYLDEVYATVKRLQPDCQISTDWTIGDPNNIKAAVLPAQQKDGDPIRYFPSDFRASSSNLPATPDPKHFVHDGKSYYMPFEATLPVSTQNHWFAHSGDQSAKSAAQLEDLFYAATAQDNLLVLNIPADKEGNLIPAQVASVMELAKRLNLGPGKPFPRRR